MAYLHRLLDRRNRPAWAVLFISITLTFLAGYGLHLQTQNYASQQFELHVRDVLDSIEERMHQQEQILLGGVGLFDASDKVTRADWQAYVERLNLTKNYPGIQGVGFSRYIRPDELNSHIEQIRSEGFPQYTVRPAGDRPAYTSIIYLEPFVGRNLAAFGFDMMSEATRARAMRAAVDSNLTTITNKVKLVQETHGKVQAGLLMYLPVYKIGRSLATEQARWEALQGFVYSPYRMGDLMSGIMGHRALMLDFSIFDGNENEDARMYDSTDERRATPAMMTTLRTIEVYGKSWTVRLSSRPEFEAGIKSPLHSIVLVMGGGISLMFFMLVLFLISRREHAEKIAHEMTADIRANEQKLRQSEARIKAIVEGAEHLIISTDVDGMIQSFNGSAERHLGYRAEELIGQCSPALFHDPAEVVKRAAELTAGGMSVEPGFEVFIAKAKNSALSDTHQWTYVRKDGSTFKVSLTVTALNDESGNIYGYLGIATDITAQLRAEQIHIDDEARLKAILDNVLDGIITIDESGIIQSFNKAASSIFGYDAPDVIGHNIKRLMPEPYQGEHDGYLHNYVSTGQKKIIGTGRQVTGLRRDGTTFPMDLAVSEMQLLDQRLFTGVVRDITELVKTERMKSEFISTVSHELRTPLTSIRGSLALIVGGVAGELPPAIKPLLEIAHKNSERLILLVNDILDMEKIEAGKMEFDMRPLKLMPLVAQAIEGNRAYGDQFGVTYEIESALPDAVVNADANRLMQVFANLLSNAAKFSRQGGQVKIGIEQIGRYIRVSVKDNGSGIADEFKGQLFSKFAQADASDTKKKGGTGLGLCITKAIVEQMGGRIDFTSKPDVLTTFFVELPVWDAVQKPDASAASEPARILICEDDRDTATLLQLMLEKSGLAADIACDAPQAKQMLAQKNYAAMTLDLAIPGQDGISLIRELRAAKERSTLPIIVVSATAHQERDELSGEAFSVIDWIGKPIDLPELERSLRRAVGQFSGARAAVLHVEDDPDLAVVVNAIVGELADIDVAITLEEARRKLKARHYDLAILDISMPDGSGLDLLPELNRAVPATPVMVFSASEVMHEDLRGIKCALVKSRTNNAQLLETIKQLIHKA